MDPEGAARDAAETARTGAPRPWVRATQLTSGRAVALLATGALLVVWLTSLDFATHVFTAALLLAVLPLPLYLGIALWMDRYEPEPRAMLATAFFWGASVAILVSGLLNAFADTVVGAAIGSVVTGPVFEECAKAVILFRFYRTRPDEFDGIIDGLIYASMVGLGFACVENIDYYARSLAKEGVSGLALTFTLRGVMSPFSHPLFTAMTGLGLGLARQTSRAWVRTAAPGAGLVLAVGLHGLWNAGAIMGCVFFAIYLLVMVPMLVTIAVIAARALKREGRLIHEHLAGEAADGRLSADDFTRLGSIRGRLDASYRAWTRGGRAGWRERRAFHGAASELAFLRHRVATGRQPADPELEAAYLRALGITPAVIETPVIPPPIIGPPIIDTDHAG